MTPELKILFVEDLPSDVELAKRTLTKEGIVFQSRVVDTEADFLRELEDFLPDIIISDYQMPQFNGMRALNLTLEKCPATPFILLTGSMNEETAIECMKSGATDYIIKEHITRLPLAVKDALEKKKIILEKMDAENLVLEQRKRLAFHINHSPLAIIEWDANFVVTQWSGEAENMFGWSASETMGKPIMDLNMIYEADIPIVQKTMERLTDGKSNNVVSANRNYTKSRQIIYCEWYNSILQDKEGKMVSVLSQVLNVTERKLAEEKLKESEERFRSVAQSANDAIVTVDSNGIILNWNAGAERIFGYTENEIVGKDLTAIIPQRYVEQHINGMKRIEQGGEHHVIGKTVELHGLHKNGKEFPLELSLAEWETSSGKFFTGIIRDITERKLEEEELLKLSRAVEQSSASVIITNAGGDIEYVNAKFCDITGYSKEEAIGENPRILKSGHQDKTFYEELWNTILSGKTWSGEFLDKKKDGELYWESARISPMVNKDGDITHFVAVQEDITEKKKMIEELVIAKEKAEKSDKLKTEFLAQMSHEIRSPMNVVLSFTEFIKEELKDGLSPQLAAYIAGIEDAGKRLIRTVELILSASEMQVGTYQPTWTTVDLMSEILNNISRDYSNAANQKGLQLTLKSRISDPKIFCDKYSVNQIFINLVDNAIKYTNEGTVNILVDKNEENKIKVTVEDTGIGMSEEFIALMYEPFMQEERGYSRRYEGNGLGLSLVKKYCELNRATIAVESEKKKGTKFIVTFPQDE